MENNGLHDEGRLDGSRVKKVGMVAHFAKLHEDVNHRHEVTTGQRFPGPVNQMVEGQIQLHFFFQFQVSITYFSPSFGDYVSKHKLNLH